jgi:hypothetical protein
VSEDKIERGRHSLGLFSIRGLEPFDSGEVVAFRDGFSNSLTGNEVAGFGLQILVVFRRGIHPASPSPSASPEIARARIA